jgi:uncharacterized protein (TIGR01319 family)
MSEAIPIESVIAADIGSTYTHACLIDQVEGVFRLVAQVQAPTTLGGAEDDLMLGMRRALRLLGQVAQRPLLDARDELITPEEFSGAGVDAFVATCSAAPPLRCALIGLTQDLSIQSALRACAGAPVAILRTVALGERHRREQTHELAALRPLRLDLILMVGGIDAGHTALVESAAGVIATIYAHVHPEERPAILFAGNQEARRPIADIVKGAFDYRVVENVRPSLDAESPQELLQELAQLYGQRKIAAVPGYGQLSRWCAAPVMATADALAATWRYIAQRDDLHRVLGVDVGGASTLLTISRRGMPQCTVASPWGTASGMRRLVEVVGTTGIRQWLAAPMSSEDIYSETENAALRPHGIPQTAPDMHLTQAVARQAIQLVVQQMQERFGAEALSGGARGLAGDLIAARGGSLVHASHEGMAALTLLDALQPVGLTRLALDGASIWPALGAAARVAPLAASQVLERDGLHELGVVIAPAGSPSAGLVTGDKPALSVTILYEDGRVTEADVPHGDVQRFPLGPYERAIIQVRPHRELDIGLGRPGQGGRTQVRGGSLGIIVDARGRPLRLPDEADERYRKVTAWLANLCL